MCSMRSASQLAFLAATACLGGCASGSSGPSAAISRTASTSTAAPAVAVAPETRPTPAGPGPGAPDGDTEPHARRSQLSTARAAAEAFFETYVEYLSGRLPARHVADVSPALRAQLESGRAETTPAERASHPRVGRVRVAIAGPPVSVTAVAFVELGTGQRSQPSATLEPAGRTWRVIAIGG
jgi:hypothetical protein